MTNTDKVPDKESRETWQFNFIMVKIKIQQMGISVWNTSIQTKNKTFEVNEINSLNAFENKQTKKIHSLT